MKSRPRGRSGRRGFGFTVDAIIALSFMVIIFAALVHMRFTESGASTSSFLNLHYISEDAMRTMNQRGLLDTLGDEWTTGNQSNASIMAAAELEAILPDNLGYALLFNDDIVAEGGRPEDEAIAKTHANRLLVGYAENATVEGAVARSFLSGISGKTSSAYAYFGGFVGQGNITRYLYVPEGVGINSAYMEMDAGSSFNMFVNGVGCNNPHSPGAGYLSADIQEDISGCAFTTGGNTINIEFTGGNIEEQFIGGGFIRVTYTSDYFNETGGPDGSDRYEFPGIDGFINHYSSFYVPGGLESMDIHLEFDNEYTTFLRVGDTLVFNSSGSPATQVIDLDDSYLQGKLDYASLSGETIPLRLGTADISEVIEEGVADVILITDLSGSMQWRVGYLDGDGVARDCDDPDLFDSDTRRVSLAKCLDQQFVDIILSGSGNRVGLVGFDDDADLYHALSNDSSSLLEHIDDYPDSPNGGTCICCAINRAYSMLEAQSSPGRYRYIIVMSDGITSYCCGYDGWWLWRTCDSEGTSTSGQYQDCGGGSSDCTGSQCNGAISNAIWSGERTHDDLNVTINSVGFGPVADCENGNYTLREIAEAGNGTYCASTNASELEDCYVRFATEIVEAALRSQILSFTGDVTPSRLYPSSYLDYTYAPIVSPLEYGEILLSYDTPRFDDNVTCKGNFFIPENAEAVDAKVTSYSSEHWTHHLQISNSGGTQVLYDLGDYGIEYYELGDPFTVQVLPSSIRSGEDNTVRISTGDAPSNDTGCSKDNRAILMIKLQGSSRYGDVFAKEEGCNWFIVFEDGTNISVAIPADYDDGDQCAYSPGNITYDEGDAIDDAVYRMLANLDTDEDGRVDIKFDAQQVNVESSSSLGIRSLWGPAKIRLVVWM